MRKTGGGLEDDDDVGGRPLATTAVQMLGVKLGLAWRGWVRRGRMVGQTKMFG